MLKLQCHSTFADLEHVVCIRRRADFYAVHIAPHRSDFGLLVQHDEGAGFTEAFQQTAKRAGIDIEIIPGDGKQVLTKYRARTHDMYIGQWGADYWDPNTNATFVQNTDNSDDAKAKPLAWRNAWMVPELNKMADTAVLERDTAKRKKMYEDMQAEFRKTSPFIMLYQQTEVAALRSNVDGL